MSHATYPTTQEVIDRIISLGIIDTEDEEFDSAERFSQLDIANKIASAVGEWNNSTRYSPFLSTGTDETRKFDPPHGSRYLFFDIGLVSLTSVVISGIPYTLDQDFFLWPANCDKMNEPWLGLEFLRRVHGAPRSVSITGKFGYSLTVPDQAWEAVMCKVLALCQPELATALTGGVFRFEEGSLKIQYASGSESVLSRELAQWEKTFNSAKKSFTRTVI